MISLLILRKHLRIALALLVAMCLSFVVDRPARAQSRTYGSYIGVWLRDVSSERAAAAKLDSARGVEVASVEDGSPAQRAGLRTGDILLAFNSETILGQMQVRRLVAETPPERRVKIDLWRDGKTQTVTVITATAHSMGSLAEPAEVPSALMYGVTPLVVLAWKVPALGLECEPIGAQLAEFFGVKHGVLIRSIDPDSGAEKAGLKAGDVLLAIGDQPLNSPRDLTAFMRSAHDTGKPINFLYVRGRKELTAKFNASPDIP